MGQSSSSSSGRGPQDDTVDYGSLHPQGVYTATADWNQNIVSRLIVERKLAPFYRPLEDYEETWDDEQILAARKPLPEGDPASVSEGSTPQPPRMESSSSSFRHHNKQRPSMIKDAHPPRTPTAAVYKSAVECPICFLYYPPNINHSRCCDQAICTECFVQIKRSEPTTTHLSSEPAACPYCVQDNFGVVYTPPVWRAGIGSEGTSPMWADSPKGSQQSIETSAPIPTHKRRQKSFGPDAPEVVTTDQIRPDWEAKVNAVRAAVARRANRRIIMRQVGDRLIPVGVTSGRVHPLNEEGEAPSVNGEGRRSRRNRPRQEGDSQYMGINGQDLDDLMMMEAMRLSMLEHEEHQRKQAAEKEKEERDKAKADASAGIFAGSSTSAATLSQAVDSESTLPPFHADVEATPTPSRRPSPPPSNTLAAAYMAPITPDRTSLGGESSAALVGSPAPPTESPHIPDDGPVTAGLVSHDANARVEGETPDRPTPSHMDSFASSIVSTGDSGETPYNFLPSDDESVTDARVPLLRTETIETHQR